MCKDTLIEREAHGDGYAIEYHADPYPQNPRGEFDHVGVMVCWHRRYDLGDAHTFTDADEFAAYLQEEGRGAVVLPLYLYDHSGISISTRSFVGRAHQAAWDSGQVGWIFCTRERAIQEWGKTRMTARVRRLAEACLRAEVEEYDQYIRGEVCGYRLIDPDGGDIDSCWGFYGLEACKEEAESSLRYYRGKRADHERAVLERLAIVGVGSW